MCNSSERKKLIDPVVFIDKKQASTGTLIEPISFVTEVLDGNGTDVEAQKAPELISPAFFVGVPPRANSDTTPIEMQSKFIPFKGCLGLPPKSISSLPTSLTMLKKRKTRLCRAKGSDPAVATKGRSDPLSVARKMEQIIPFCRSRGILYYFDGKLYRQADDALLCIKILEVCEPEVQEQGKPSLISDAVKFLKMDFRIAPLFEGYKTNCLCFRDGTLDVGTGIFQPFHTPEQFITSALAVDYTANDVGSGCLHFDNFIKQIAGGVMEIELRIWELLGYLISPDAGAKIFGFFVGYPDTGKSVLGNFIASLFESEFVSRLELSRLSEKFAPSHLLGKVININLDLPNERIPKRAISMLKQLTGGDATAVEAKYKAHTTLNSGVKFLFASNHVLLFDNDPAFVRRILAIPFLHTIPLEAQRPDILKLFESEKSAVVKKAIYHYRRLVCNNYIFSGEAETVSAIRRFSSSDNSDALLLTFIEAKCEFGLEFRTYTHVLFQCFTEFCTGKPNEAGNIVSFSMKISELCGDLITRSKWRENGGVPLNGFIGLRLKI